MILSMTGYGSAKETLEGFEISVELKSVNNRYLETNIRIPRSFIFAEDAVKSCIAKHVSRGKVDVFINITSDGADDVTVKIDEGLLKGYLGAINKIAEDFSLSPDINALAAARFPDVLSVERAEVDAESISAAICEVTEKALADYDKMRIREGEKLREDILSKLETIKGYVAIVEEKAPETVEKYRKRLEDKMLETLNTAGIDESRILAEAAIFADHIAVDEETVRLKSHISQLTSMINGSSPIGRKIDFLVQEFNREANTIGSKCQNSEIAYIVVDLKSEIEKIREQIQNIE